jgi:type IV pilus assembly protein PilV
MRAHSISQPLSRLHNLGFSMIEILVTILLISLALLGTSGLQAYALKLNQGAQFRTQAVLLASDLAERMDANKFGAVAGSYVYNCPATAEVESTACGPGGGSCTPAALANYDLLQWRASVTNTLPASTCSVVQSAAGNPSTYTISISWVDRQANTNYDNSVVSGTGELLTYTASRIIFN